MSDDGTQKGRGFARPPTQSQFQQGQSGNPRGRPKGSRNLKTDLANLLRGKVEITINGERRRMTRQEAMLFSLFQRAVQKDAPAAKMLFDMAIKLELPDDQAKLEPTLSPADHIIIENFLRRNGALKSEV